MFYWVKKTAQLAFHNECFIKIYLLCMFILCCLLFWKWNTWILYTNIILKVFITAHNHSYTYLQNTSYVYICPFNEQCKVKKISGELQSLVINTSQGIIYFHKNHMEWRKSLSFLSQTSIDVNSCGWSKTSKVVSYGMPQEFLMKVPNNDIEGEKCQNVKHFGKVTKVTMDRDAVLMALLGT